MKHKDAIKRVSLEYLADAERFINIAGDIKDANEPKKEAALNLATDRIQAVIALLTGEDK